MGALTNFPDGISSLGMPVVGSGLPIASQYYFVHSTRGSNGYDGSFELPFATIDYAIGKCTANRGDVIAVLAGHAETLTAAGGIAADVAGISIIGIGTGADRPEVSFGTATTASCLVTAANVTIKNIVGISAIDALTNPFNIQAAGCVLDIEWQDPSSSLQAVRAVLTNASADNFTCKIKVAGITSGGTAPVNVVRLVGCNGGRIILDTFGRASTAAVEFVTTACTDVVVSGYVFNSGTTDGSKNIIDTVTGSTWFANFYDGAAGANYSGGSAAALAADDVATVASALNAGTADASTNTLARDVTGNKTDASVYVPGTTKSVAAYVKGTADLQERVAKKAAATIVNAQVLFTVAGGPIQIIGLVSICETANDTTASTLQYSATPTVGAATTISGASASLASAAAGASVTLAGTALATAALLNANGPNLIANPGTVVAPAGTITAVVGVGSTTGTWAHYLRYKPLATGVTVS